MESAAYPNVHLYVERSMNFSQPMEFVKLTADTLGLFAEALPEELLDVQFLHDIITHIIGRSGQLFTHNNGESSSLSLRTRLRDLPSRPYVFMFRLHDATSDLRRSMVPSTELNRNALTDSRSSLSSHSSSQQSVVKMELAPALVRRIGLNLGENVVYEAREADSKRLQAEMTEAVVSRDLECRVSKHMAVKCDTAHLVKKVMPRAGSIQCLTLRILAQGTFLESRD